MVVVGGGVLIDLVLIVWYFCLMVMLVIDLLLDCFIDFGIKCGVFFF